MKVSALAYKDWETVTNKDPIFGVKMGEEKRQVYRVRVALDGQFFTSCQKYKSFEGAVRAAKRLEKKSGEFA